MDEMIFMTKVGKDPSVNVTFGNTFMLLYTLLSLIIFSHNTIYNKNLN